MIFGNGLLIPNFAKNGYKIESKVNMNKTVKNGKIVCIWSGWISQLMVFSLPSISVACNVHREPYKGQRIHFVSYFSNTSYFWVMGNGYFKMYSFEFSLKPGKQSTKQINKCLIWIGVVHCYYLVFITLV